MRSDYKGHLRVEVVDEGSGFIPVARPPMSGAGACTSSRRSPTAGRLRGQHARLVRDRAPVASAA